MMDVTTPTDRSPWVFPWIRHKTRLDERTNAVENASMSSKARLSLMVLAVLPAASALALDPTLPQPGRAKPATPPATTNTPAVQPAPAVADTTPVEAPAADRKPVPDPAAIAEAQKLADQVYKDELLAAKTADQKKQLAVKFRQLALASEPAAKYALLARAREIAADAGDADTALGSVADVERSFDFDGGAMEIDAVARLQRTLRTPDALKGITRHLLGSANQAVAGDRFESARKLIDQAAIISSRINDPAIAKLIAARAKEIREVEAAYTAAKPALEAVAKQSADPAQNLSAGRYKVLFKGEFPAGLPLLAAGADDPLKDVAVKDIAGASTAEQQDALGDAWYGVAEKLTGVAKNHATIRAAGFYAQAAPSLAGLQQAKAAKRAKEAEPLASMYVGRPASAGGAAGTPAVAVNTPSQTPTVKPPDNGSTSTGTSGVKINLPGKFVRIWKTPEVWANKPEDVTFKNGRLTIINAGGTVCENEPLTPQKDGSLTLTWDYGPDKTGFEVWTIKDGDLLIHRWNSKAELDQGKPPRRVGTMTK